jgi:hypothetical protein
MTDSIRIFDPGFRVTDANGVIVSGAIVKVFDAGGTTPREVFSNSGLSSSLGTEVDCNSAGAPTSDGNNPCLIYTGITPYRVRLTTSDGTLIPGMDFDNISGALDTSDYLTDADVAPDFPITNTSSNVAPVAADKGKFWNINCSGGDVTVTFPAATTLGNGWNAKFRHDGTANQVSFIADGSELFKIGSHAGVARFAAPMRGQVYTITCDGTGYKVEQTAPALFNTTGVIVIADRLSTPPSAEAGARYIVGSGPAGAWSTYAQHDIAEYTGSAWFNITPPSNSGWVAYVLDEARHYFHYTSGWDLLVNKQGAMAYTTQSGTISAAATVDFTIPSDADEIEIILDNIVPASDATALHMRFSQSASFLAGASDYQWSQQTSASGSSVGTGDNADNQIQLYSSLGTGTNEVFSAAVRIRRPRASSTLKNASWIGGGLNSSPTGITVIGFGCLIANSNAIDGVRFLMSSGNIASGNYTVMARRYS